ncbi:alpha/beta fold hydrolase [Jatrophihabitans fulvus]
MKYVSRLLAPPALDRATALTRMERVCALTHVMASAEHLARPQFRRPGGLNNWRISRDSSAFRSPAARRVLEVIGDERTTTAVHAARLAAAAAVLLPGGRRRRLVADTALAASSLLLHPRHHYGTDGSDQVSFLVQAAAALARSGRSPALTDACLWAVGIQGTMSYAVSGWAKLAGPSWRQGRALEGVARTMTYGDEWTWRLTHRFPLAARAVGASVLALECAAPVVYLGRGRLVKTYTLGVTAMHVGIARTMALGRFVPSFLSMHPAMAYTARRRGSTAADAGGPRDDTVPRLFGLAVMAVAAQAVVQRRRNRRATLVGHGDEAELRTSDGNRLRYRRTGAVGAPGPVYVFENALLATPEHWGWVAEELGAQAEIVTYHRAGYGGSTADAGTALVLGDLVAHAVELVDAVADGRPVVLVGHSLGGYLAMRAAAVARSDVAAVVLVDSSHPEELERSPRQSAGADTLSQTFPLIARSLDLGAGSLLAVPDWVRSLPQDGQAAALAQYRDSRMWRAGRREWAATLRDFRGGASLPRLSVPILGVSAAKTVQAEQVQRELHEEMVGQGAAGSRFEVIARANHDSILTDRAHAGTLVRLVRDFVASLPDTTPSTGSADPAVSR